VSRRLAYLISLVVALVLFAGCGSGGSSNGAGSPSGSGTSRSSGGGVGKLIITKPEGLVEYNIADASEKKLITPETPNTFVLDPALSADGTQLAYIVQPPPKVENNKYDAGSDVWVANRDGTGARQLLAHTVANQLIRFPRWLDAKTVLAVIQHIETANAQTNVVYTLERIDVTTGTHSEIMRNVLSFDVAPDGKKFAYAKIAPQLGETLNGANIDGSGDAVLVGLEQNLSPFNFPRYSPDGSKIAVASADQTGARAPVELVAAHPAGHASAAFDGLPEDIWTVDAAGGTAVRVANIKEDLPSLTWSGDGKHIYVVGSLALYDVNVTSGAVNQIGPGSFHAQIVWAPS
jgi:Tol biopolymer transport system component